MPVPTNAPNKTPEDRKGQYAETVAVAFAQLKELTFFPDEKAVVEGIDASLQ